MNLFKDLISVDLKKDMGLYNMTDDFFGVYLKSIKDNYKKNILVVVDSLYEVNKLYNRINELDNNILLFPMDDFLTSEAIAVSPDLMIKRLETFNSIVENNDNKIIITNLMGYLRFLPKKEDYINSFIELKIGDTIKPNDLVNKLIKIGYKRDTIVNKTGEFGVRGFVVDIFSIDYENPVRIEFFDDEIESIRFFNPDTQKSISNSSSIIIKPFFEFICNSSNIDDDHYGKQKYLQIYQNVSNILDYLDDCITIFKDYNQLETSFKNILNETMIYRNEKDKNFDLNYMFNLDDIKVLFPMYYCSINNLINNKLIRSSFDFNVKTISKFNEKPELINDFINNSINNKKTIIICVKGYQKRNLLKYLNMKINETSLNNIKLKTVNIIDLIINQGFIYNDFIFLTASELFNINNMKKKYKTKYKYSSTISDVNKLNIGDYIVHNTHGIGRYNGIRTLSLNDITKDY